MRRPVLLPPRSTTSGRARPPDGGCGRSRTPKPSCVCPTCRQWPATCWPGTPPRRPCCGTTCCGLSPRTSSQVSSAGGTRESAKLCRLGRRWAHVLDLKGPIPQRRVRRLQGTASRGLNWTWPRGPWPSGGAEARVTGSRSALGALLLWPHLASKACPAGAVAEVHTGEAAASLAAAHPARGSGETRGRRGPLGPARARSVLQGPRFCQAQVSSRQPLATCGHWALFRINCN